MKLVLARAEGGEGIVESLIDCIGPGLTLLSNCISVQPKCAILYGICHKPVCPPVAAQGVKPALEVTHYALYPSSNPPRSRDESDTLRTGRERTTKGMDMIAVEPTDSEALNEARAQVAITAPERLAAFRVWYSDSSAEQGKPQTPAEGLHGLTHVAM